MASRQSIRNKTKVAETETRFDFRNDVIVYKKTGIGHVNGRIIGAIKGRPDWFAISHVCDMHLAELKNMYERNTK
jgi:hypothetical protein